MFSPADAELAARDPAVPGLTRLLDPDALRHTIQSFAPNLDITNLNYLRYKPGTSCLVGFDLMSRAQIIPAWALALNARDHEKYSKIAKSKPIVTALGDRPIASSIDRVVIGCFPLDPDLEQLRRLTDDGKRGKLLGHTMRSLPALHRAMPQMLAYRRGRRYVAKVSSGDQAACLRLYSTESFLAAAKATRALSAASPTHLPRVLSIDKPYRAIALEWAEGRPLDIRADDAPLESVGAALAELHHVPTDLPVCTPQAEANRMLATAGAIKSLCPSLARHASDIAAKLASALCADAAPAAASTHGDFYAAQVLIGNDSNGVTLIDFDEACRCEPEADLASFLAHAAIDQQFTDERIADLRVRLLHGYGGLDERRLEVWYAASLMRLATSPFRYRRANWPERIEAILELISRVIDTAPLPARTVDPLESLLSRATNLSDMSQRLIEYGQLRAAEITRQKPGRRALIEYTFVSPHGAEHSLLGKLRAKGPDHKTFEVVQKLRLAGLDGVHLDAGVPEPIAKMPDLNMWLQRRVAGEPAITALLGVNGTDVAQRIAAALHTLQTAKVPARKAHGLPEELAILRERLGSVMLGRPHLGHSIESVLQSAERATAQFASGVTAGVHRDFYHDQVLVDGRRIWLLDLDCYAAGDPALDAGNFIAHLIEYALRTTGSPAALERVQTAFCEEFLSISESDARAVDLFTALSLARHIWISTLHVNRHHITDGLIDLSLQRLAALS